MKVLIIGGGIAGVTLAHLLEENHEVTLIEKGSEWRTIGFGVGIWKNGLDILNKLPLGADFWAKGYPVVRGATIAAPGQKLLEASFATPESNIESTALVFEREHLHTTLHNLLKKTDVRFNTTVIEIKNLKDQADVKLSTGEELTFDLVVGADGIRSATRSMIFGEKLVPYGWNIWGTWISQEDAPFPGYYVFGGKNETLLGFPYFDKHVVGMMYKSDMRGQPPASREEMLAHFPNLSVHMQGIVQDIDNPSGIFSDTLAHVEMKEWYKDRVVLIGDARHGMSPLTGMGTSLALEDAWVLAEELSDVLTVEPALKQFSCRRDRRLRSLKLFRGIIEFVGMVESRISEIFRDTVMPLMPPSLAIWILEKIFATKV